MIWAIKDFLANEATMDKSLALEEEARV